MDNKQLQFQRRVSKRRESVIGGILLLCIGGIWLARQAGAEIPSWLFTWPMILIIVGLFVGAKTNFRDFGWVALVGVGSFFLIDRIHGIPLKQYFWPILIIGAGLVVLLGAFFKKSKIKEEVTSMNDANDHEEWVHDRSEEIMEVISVFGSTRRVVLSKNVKGGEVISVFGSSEINLTNADFKGTLTLEVVQIFGGTKLIIPPHWEVQTKTAVIFGGIEDKRSIQTMGNPEKLLIIEGVNIFGGVTISSY